MTLKALIARLQGMLGAINRLPSWLNEGLGGGVAVGVAALGLLCVSLVAPQALRWVFPLAFGLSEAYERWLDPWGYNPQDVVERARGIVVVMVVATIFWGRVG